ncbi:MAG: alanine racemase [Proteobacteria bacterium]|nr:alanine racemase [Pseudomonadota bacterium]
MIENKVIVDLGAIRHNLFEIKRLAGSQSRVIAVIKSDAYGHGMIAVGQTLESSGVDSFGVFELEEALDLRKAHCRIPILLMKGITADEVSAAVEKRLTVALFQQDIAEKLSGAALKQGTVTPVHVKIDTGMGRLGVPWEDASDFLQGLLSLNGLLLEGIFSHCAVADEPDHPFTDEQIGRFLQVVKKTKQLGVCTDAVHLANSGALLARKGIDLGMVRPGILLYGSPPAEGLAGADSFKPAMTFKSRVTQVKKVPADTPISYGCTYRTRSTSTIATVPVGYDDGYSRMLSNKGEVLIHGRRVPIVGRVCMNLTMVDVSSLDGVSVGDEVVLLGAQGKERITAEELARRIGTISYEVYCMIGKNNRRVHVDSQKR